MSISLNKIGGVKGSDQDGRSQENSNRVSPGFILNLGGTGTITVCNKLLI